MSVVPEHATSQNDQGLSTTSSLDTTTTTTASYPPNYTRSQYPQSNLQSTFSSAMPQYNTYPPLENYNINYAAHQQINYIQPSESYQSYNNNAAATWSAPHLPASSYDTSYAGSSSGVAYTSHVHPTRNSSYPPTNPTSYSTITPYSSSNFQEHWGSSHVDTHIIPASYTSSSSYATPDYLPAEPYRYGAYATNTRSNSAQLSTPGSNELMLSPYSNGSVPLSSSPTGTPPVDPGFYSSSGDEEPHSQAAGSPVDSISRAGQYSHREQIQLFRDALSMPYSPNAGPFIPQKMYKPHTNSDRRRYVEEIDLNEPIYFWMENPSECGISLSDALHSRVRRLLDREKTVFEGRGPSVSIRLEWPGYRPWSRQIPTKDFRTPPGPITRAKLAKNVAKCVLRFISERQNHSLEDEYDSRWRVASSVTRGIKLEDLILVSMHHVSMGSWQPHLRLARPLVA